MLTDIEKIIYQINEKVNQSLDSSGESDWNFGWDNITSKPIEEWTNKDFVLYFKNIFFEVKDSDYNITFAIDIPEIQKIKSELSKNGHKRKKDLKLFLDWCKENKSEILQKNPDFMLHDLKLFLNNFSAKEENSIEYDTEFLKRLNEFVKNGKPITNLLESYGIPIISTYIEYIMDKDKSLIYKNIEKKLIKLVNERKVNSINKIAKQSINMSPYPENFNLLKWREEFSYIWDKFDCTKQNWWRNADYNSEIPKHYLEIVNVRK